MLTKSIFYIKLIIEVLMSINELNLGITEGSKKNLSIYVHIPFCNSKCAYCSFVSMVGSEDDKKRYFNDIVSEIKMQAKNYSPYYSVSSIYIGGGTPSCFDYYYIRDLLSCIYKNFAVKNSAEITMEINPNSLEKNKIREYILSGVNRFSIGLQSISPKILETMGRTHTADEFEKAVKTIREFGIKNISADIIIGYPGQKLAQIKETISYLLKLDIPHISAYMLQVEKDTPLKKLVDNGSVGLPDEDLVVDMYNSVVQMLTDAGYERYELSNFAKPSYRSYHNQIYWDRKDYLGFGLAAHSYLEGTRFANTSNIIEYADRIENKKEVPIAHSKTLDKQELMEEAVMLSLRTSNGLDIEAYKQEFGENFLAKKKDLIADYIKNGFLVLTKENKLVCTDRGFMVLNKIVLDLVS